MINQAAQDGPSSIAWWQDWRGQYAAVIASGPSVKKEQVAQLRGRVRVLAIKRNVDLAPWADAVYGCDAHWWNSRQGLPEFKGLKLAYTSPLLMRGEIKQIHIEREHDAILVKKPGEVGSGGNSGFQALNLAVQFGALGIMLIGFDMKPNGNSPHWYGRNDWPGCANPMEHNYQRWQRAFDSSAPMLAELGVDVVNCSTFSALKHFRRASIADTLIGWGS
jgi:hypothetical protein